MKLRDYLNVPTRDELYGFVLQDGQAIAVLGITEQGDIPQETWYFNGSSMEEDNGETVIRPIDIPDTDPGRYLINMVQADWNAIFNIPVFAEVAFSGNYDDLGNKITNGQGIRMTGNEISVDDTEFMTVSYANTALAAMQSDIATKVPVNRTITLNGITQELSSNRSWEVGNVSTNVSYSNPSFINSLAYSKLTGAPSIPSPQVKSDWSSSSGLSEILNKPVIPTNTNQLTNGAGFIVTEADPTVPAYSKSLTAFSVIRSSTDPLYKSISYTPTSTEIITALGYTPTGSLKTVYNPTRTLNTNFTISATKEAVVTYTIRIAYNVTVLLGSVGTVILQYSTNGGTTFSNLATVSNSINLGLALTGYNDFTLSAPVPAGALCRLTSTVTNATNTIQNAIEYY